MSKFLIKLLFALSLAFTAPVMASASISLEDQRIEVAAALTDVVAEIDAEIALIDAALLGGGLTPTEITVLEGQRAVLVGRKNLVLSIIAAVPTYSQSTLDVIILRFDLPVSLS